MKNINNYKCLACGGGVKFDPKTGMVVCEYCDSKFTIEEIEKAYGNPEEEGAEVSGSDEQIEKSENEAENEDSSVNNEGFDSGDTNWDTGGLSSDWGSDGSKMREYSCPSCGASLICEETTAATSCPYCDNPTVIEKQFAGNLKPDYVIPFKLTKKDAIEALKKFYNGKKLLPKAFSNENHLEETKGIYVPFWFFNGTTIGNATFKTTKRSSTRRGNTETITTYHYSCYREGTLDFKMVPVDASKKMPNDMMDSLEPFNYKELKEFSTAYLPGYLADKYDDTVENCFPRANTRCAQTLLSDFRASVNGYNTVSLIHKNIKLKSGKVNYGLVPVYLLYTKWHDEKYLFAVNGQTGKVVGKLPMSGKLAFLYTLKNFLISSAVGGLIYFLILKIAEHAS